MTPMKSYWMGEPIDDMPREKLLEIIDHLGRELEAARDGMRRHLEMERMFAAARAERSRDAKRWF
jgi:hypothetical protein